MPLLKFHIAYYGDMSQRYPVRLRHLGYGLPLVVLGVFVSLTDPQTLSLPLLLVPFVLLFFILFGIIRLAAEHIFHLKHLNRSVASFFLALFPVILLLLSSANQVSVADVSVVVLLFIGVVLYLRRADFL